MYFCEMKKSLKNLLNQRSLNLREYDQILKNYSSQGYRIFEKASKKIVYNNHNSKNTQYKNINTKKKN
jgi:magnesium-transporting ATPase (P-type)